MLIGLFSLSASAQTVTQLPWLKDSKTVWIVRAGASFNGVSGSAIDAQKESWQQRKYDGSFGRSTGVSLSVAFNRQFGKSPLYWGMELGAGMRGYKTEANYSSSGSLASAGNYHYSTTRTETNKLNAFNVQFSPITIGGRIAFGQSLALDLHVGGYASYDLAGKLKSESSYSSQNSSVHGSGGSSKDESNSVKIGDIEGYSNHDFGVVAGGGIWFGHFNVDFTWQRGFVAIFDGDNDLFTNNMTLRLGYAF